MVMKVNKVYLCVILKEVSRNVQKLEQFLKRLNILDVAVECTTLMTTP